MNNTRFDKYNCQDFHTTIWSQQKNVTVHELCQVICVVGSGHATVNPDGTQFYLDKDLSW